MALHFVKMHGLGNDFVIVNNIGKNPLVLPESEITALCNRNTGVGCDQLIVLESAIDADCEMLIYNIDGSKSGACGNATRCVAKLIKASTIRVGSRKLRTTLHEDGEVSVDMGAYTKPEPITVLGYHGYLVDVGNPHFVHFGGDIKAMGPELVNHPIFAQGANINCATITSDTRVTLNVWERGAGETLACGTGACATAIAAHLCMGLSSQIDVHLKGGILHISVGPDCVLMKGPATKVFTGSRDN